MSENSEKKQKGTLLHDALILFAITLVAATLLGFVYEITKEPIAKAQAKAKAEAYARVFPGLVSTDDTMNAQLDVCQKMLDEDEELAGTRIDELLTALDADGNSLGWVMTITGTGGYGGEITIALGIAQEFGSGRKVHLTGVEFLSISETAGLGMKAKDEEFKGQFRDAYVNRYSFAKKNISGDTEIDAISSATVTTAAVTRMVDAGLAIGGTYVALNDLIEVMGY